jgi:hypothetical protein
VSKAFVELERLRAMGVPEPAIEELARLEKRIRAAEHELERRGKLLDELNEELLLRRREERKR